MNIDMGGMGKNRPQPGLHMLEDVIRDPSPMVLAATLIW